MDCLKINKVFKQTRRVLTACRGYHRLIQVHYGYQRLMKIGYINQSVIKRLLYAFKQIRKTLKINKGYARDKHAKEQVSTTV